MIVEGQLVSGILLRKVNLSGDMPTLDKENFTEVKMKGVLLTPPSGKTSVHYLRAREVTGKATAAPTITKFEPASAKVGDTVTVTGTNFDGVRRVLVGTTAASFTKRSATVLTVKVPTVSAGQQTISVVNGKGKADSATKLTVA